MTPEQILRKRLEQQREWVSLPVEEGAAPLRVSVRRPYATDLTQFAGGAITVEQVVQCVEAWEGFTEATFLGAAIGSDEPVEFDLALWADYVRDNPEAYVAVSRGLVDGVVRAADRLKALRGN